MSYAWVDEVKEHAKFMAEYTVGELCGYAEDKCVDCDFVFEEFIKAFRKLVNTERSEQ